MKAVEKTGNPLNESLFSAVKPFRWPLTFLVIKLEPAPGGRGISDACTLFNWDARVSERRHWSCTSSALRRGLTLALSAHVWTSGVTQGRCFGGAGRRWRRRNMLSSSERSFNQSAGRVFSKDVANLHVGKFRFSAQDWKLAADNRLTMWIYLQYVTNGVLQLYWSGVFTHILIYFSNYMLL